MATKQAKPGEIVKLEAMELAGFLLPPGEAIGNHHVYDPLIFHCVSDRLEVVALSKTGGVRANSSTFRLGKAILFKANHRALV